MLFSEIKGSTTKADIGISSENHIVIRVYEGIDMETDDMKELNELKKELAGENQYTLLYVAPLRGSVSHAAMQFSASREVYENMIAKAITVKSKAGRLIARVFLALNAPTAPTKIFDKESEAVAWLTEMRTKHFEINRFKI